MRLEYLFFLEKNNKLQTINPWIDPNKRIVLNAPGKVIVSMADRNTVTKLPERMDNRN